MGGRGDDPVGGILQWAHRSGAQLSGPARRPPLRRATLRQAIESARVWITTSPRWLLLRAMPVASLPLTLVVAACVLVSVALPIAFLLLTGEVIGALPEAIEQGPDSPARQRLTVALGLLGLTFIVQQVLTMLHGATADALGRRVLGSHARG